jgi:glycosyltransferase involved in cell wall biosynthesis
VKVLLLSTGADTAGLGWAMKRALDRHAPDVTARQLAAAGGRGRYLAYQHDLVYGLRREAVAWYRWADVVHLANTLWAWEHWDQGRLHKRLVLHHHGTEFRLGHAALAAKARAIGAVQVVATVDLLGLEPGLRWVPAPADSVALGQYRSWRASAPGTLRVAHAPTDRAVKGTAVVLAAVQQLQGEGLDVQLDLIEGVANEACLARKGRADVVVDQLALGYGVNAVEAWGMGLPVIAGVADPDVHRRMLSCWGRLPFALAGPDNLVDVLREFAVNLDTREDYAARGMAHFAQWHREDVVAQLLQAVYADAGQTTRRLVLQGG